MAKKRIFVDTNVIIECFRLGVWPELTTHYQVETVEECESETQRGNANDAGYVPVPLAEFKAGCHKIHKVTAAEVLELEFELPGMQGLDLGELHLFAYLFNNKVKLSDANVLCTADIGAVLQANSYSDWLDWIQSLEEVLRAKNLGGRKIDGIRGHHKADFLMHLRTDIRLKIRQ